MIQMENVTKQYANGVTAIKNLNLEIRDGEFVYVIGPSGAGKSTFVKMLYHELMPTSGTIKIDDFDFATMKPSRVPFLRRHIGIVFQDFKLLPRLTVNLPLIPSILAPIPILCVLTDFPESISAT